MPRDAGGNYTLPSGNPVISGTPIETTWANPTMEDLAAEMTDSLSRSGNGGMLVGFKVVNGDANAPSYSFTSNPTSGMYLQGSGVLAFTANSTKQLTLDVINGATFDSDLTVNGVLTPTDDITITKPGSGGVFFGIQNDDGGVQIALTGAEGLSINQLDNVGGFANAWIDGAVDGNVRLYYDGSVKLSTTINGVDISNSGATINFIVGDNTQNTQNLWTNKNFDGNWRHNYNADGNLYIQSLDTADGNSDSHIVMFRETTPGSSNDAHVELRYNNNTKLETTAGGVEVNGYVRVGVGNAGNPTLSFSASPTSGMWADDNDFLVLTVSGNNQLVIRDLDLDLRYNTQTKLSTLDTGIKIIGTIRNGNGAQTLPAYSFDSHPSSGMYNGGSGNLVLTALGINQVVIDSVAVELRHSGSKKFVTASSGINVTGSARITAVNTSFQHPLILEDPNLSGMRFRTNGVGSGFTFAMRPYLDNVLQGDDEFLWYASDGHWEIESDLVVGGFYSWRGRRILAWGAINTAGPTLIAGENFTLSGGGSGNATVSLIVPAAVQGESGIVGHAVSIFTTVIGGGTVGTPDYSVVTALASNPATAVGMQYNFIILE